MSDKLITIIDTLSMSVPAVRRSDIIAYLEKQGWNFLKSVMGQYDVWYFSSVGTASTAEPGEVHVYNDAHSWYHIATENVIKSIAEQEGRLASEVYADITGTAVAGLAKTPGDQPILTTRESVEKAVREVFLNIDPNTNNPDVFRIQAELFSILHKYEGIND